jgi:hypothetical protein
MPRFRSLLPLSILIVAGCASKVVPPAVPGANEVVLSDAAPPAGFVQLQQLSVQSGKGCGVLAESGSRQDAEAQLRREAAKLGASFVRITEVREPRPNHQCLEHEYKLSGVAYRKPATTAAPSVASAPPPSTPSVPSPTPGAIVQDYEPGAPVSKPSEGTAVSRLDLRLTAGDPSGNALSVDYGCSGTEQRALLDVWSAPRSRDWSQASALSFRIKPDAAISLSVSFMDANHAGYTQKTAPLVPGTWQTVSLPFDQFLFNPHGPPGDTPGAPLNRSNVEAFGFAPEGCANGHFAIDDFVLAR